MSDKIAEIRATWAAASPGPWHHMCSLAGIRSTGGFADRNGDAVLLPNMGGHSFPLLNVTMEDATAIASAPEHIDYLLKYADAKDMQIAALEHEVAVSRADAMVHASDADEVSVVVYFAKCLRCGKRTCKRTGRCKLNDGKYKPRKRKAK